MNDERTTAVVQRYLDELTGDSPAEPIVRALMDRAVHRLHLLCARLLYRSYPRLKEPPLNLEVDELLGAVAERLLKAHDKSTLGPYDSYSPWPTSTCDGSSMTWPAA